MTAPMPEPGLFEVATNPEPDSTLPFLIRLPLPTGALVLKARDSWPRTAKVYCHRAERWPEDAQIIERVPIRSCQRRGVAIDLVLDRPRENRSQLVFTRIQGGREGIFWQTARTTRQARPGIRVPRRLAAGLTELTILIDSRERYPYKFTQQQATTQRQALPAGDYAVVPELALDHQQRDPFAGSASPHCGARAPRGSWTGSRVSGAARHDPATAQVP